MADGIQLVSLATWK